MKNEIFIVIIAVLVFISIAIGGIKLKNYFIDLRIEKKLIEYNLIERMK